MALPCRLAALLLATPLASLASAKEDGTDVSLEMEVERYVETAEPVRESTRFVGQWRGGPRFTSADGSFEIAFRARIHLDWFWQASDEFDEDVTEDGVVVRRARIGVEGYAFTNLIYKAELDFASARTAVVDVFMGLKNVPLAQRVLVGHFKRPWSLSAMESSNYFTFLDRPPSVNAFLNLRDLGIAVATTAIRKRFRLNMGIFRQTDETGTALEGDGYSFAARLTAMIFRKRPQGHILHLGLGINYNRPAFRMAQFATDVTTGDHPPLVDTGPFPADRFYEASVEFAWILRSFAVQAEYIVLEVEDSASDDPRFDGWYVEVSYFLTGEKRKYLDVAGSFGRMSPNRDFFDGGGGPGAWQVAYRFDTVNLNSRAITGGEMRSHTIGVNWYWNPNTRVMLNFIFADVDSGPEGAGDLKVLETRFQIDF